MTILQDAKPSLVAAAKAERERDKTEAMREYQSENRASLANMARLRALRLAKESPFRSRKRHSVRRSGKQQVSVADTGGNHLEHRT